MENTHYIKKESYFSGTYSLSVLKTISMAIAPFKMKFLGALTIGIIGRGLLLGNTNILGLWIDSFCFDKTNCLNHKNNIFSQISFSNLILLLLSFCLFGFILLTLFRISVARMGTHSSARLYDETTLRVSRFPISFFDTNPIGRIITRFSSDYNVIVRMSGGPLSEVVSLTFDILLFFVLTIVASPLFIPIIILSVILNFIVYRLNIHKIRRTRRDLSSSRGPALAHFAETAQGAKIVKVLGKTKNFTENFSILQNKYIQQKNLTNITFSFFSLQMGIINIILLFIIGTYGIFLLHFNYTTVGSIGVAITFTLMTSNTIQIFFEWMSSLEDALTGTERLDEYIHKQIEVGISLPSCTNFKTNHKIHSPIEETQINDSKLFKIKSASLTVEKLSLQYEKNLPFALKDISFQVEAGEKIGIIGKTGSGKSSLIQSLYHLYPLSEGRILINNIEADVGQNKINNNKYVNLNLFRKAISLITQEPILFLGTLRENLTNLPPNVLSDEEIIYIASSLGLSSFFSNNKNALNMHIHEKGANLSAGEKQLICMTRCVLQNSPIILMDEATSAIDPNSEDIIVNAIDQFWKEKTQIIVAHRLSTIKNCNRILWFHNSKLILDGKPEIIISAFKNFEKNGDIYEL